MDHLKVQSSEDSTDYEDQACAAFETMMEEAGVHPVARRSFRHYYSQLRAGATGDIPAADALPAEEPPTVSALGRHRASGEAALSRTVIIKLNGGLGTSMGLSGPKSLIEVRPGINFLDVIARQVLTLRQDHGVRLPLVFMNSFATRDDTVAALRQYTELSSEIPLDFLQHMVPKVFAADLQPAKWPTEPALEWCPPGHGDLYPALLSSGMLSALLDAGYKWAFVSNCDNLGAIVEPAILGFMVDEQRPFVMEVTRRTIADSKGGHLARRPDGGLLLREIAQCPDDEIERAAFQDIEKYRYFNTNNLWLDLEALHSVLEARDGVLGLPLIRNQKHLDPTNQESPLVYQLETAMGAAIAVYPDAAAVAVERDRFAPVKQTADLLLLWSDVYEVDDEWRLQPREPFATGARPMPRVDLDPAFFTSFEDFKDRFPHGAPSLVDCQALEVFGDVRFEAGVVCRGTVAVRHDGPGRLVVPAGIVLGE